MILFLVRVCLSRRNFSRPTDDDDTLRLPSVYAWSCRVCVRVLDYCVDNNKKKKSTVTANGMEKKSNKIPDDFNKKYRIYLRDDRACVL